jgi:Putative methyltransferase
MPWFMLRIVRDAVFRHQPECKQLTRLCVQELGDWMRAKLDAHPLFERLSDEELEDDPAAALLTEGTEEGQKVARNSGQTWRNVYRRVASAQQ